MTDEALIFVRRVYLGSTDPADVSVVQWESKKANLRPPEDSVANAFWLLSLHAAATAKTRYRSVREWLDGKPRW